MAGGKRAALVRCDYCKATITDYPPQRCPKCGKVFCPFHLEPKAHDCSGVDWEKGKESERKDEAALRKSYAAGGYGDDLLSGLGVIFAVVIAVVILALLAFMFSGFMNIPMLGNSSPQSASAGNGGSPAERPAISVSGLAVRIHDLVNAERAGNGLPPLSWDANLSSIAQAQSEDMAARNFFGHVNPDGKNPSERARAAGYNCTRVLNVTEVPVPGGTMEYTTYTEGIGENLFKNNLYDYTLYQGGVPYYHHWNTQAQIAVSTVSGWMNSSEHRENILQKNYRQEGIGVVIAADDSVYITENFC